MTKLQAWHKKQLKAKWKIKEICSEMGIANNTYQKALKNGCGNLQPGTLKKISRVTGISVADLIEGE